MASNKKVLEKYKNIKKESNYSIKSNTKKNTNSNTNINKQSNNNKITKSTTYNKKNSIVSNKIDTINSNTSKIKNSKTQNNKLQNLKIENIKTTELPEIKQIQYIKVKKIKLNKKNLILLIVLLISIISLFCAIFNVIFWIIDNTNINKQINDINNVTNVKVVIDNENTEIIKQENINKSDPYWDYIKMDMINVDFKELLKVNSHTKGWLQVNGTNVNYPFVQTNNNEYYLKHAFDKSWNNGGWVFLDYRNNLSSDDKNTIIYGHGRQNKTIFGSLKSILENNWVNNTDNYIIKLSTLYENTLWQIFSAYRIPTTNDYIQTNFVDNNEFYTFATMLLNRSQHNFETTINETDQILTLSTCYNSNDKFVIHAKLIKKESR